MARMFKQIVPAVGIHALFQKIAGSSKTPDVTVESVLHWGLLDEPLLFSQSSIRKNIARLPNNMVGIVLDDTGLPYVCEDCLGFLGYVTEDSWESKNLEEQRCLVKEMIDSIELQRPGVKNDKR